MVWKRMKILGTMGDMAGVSVTVIRHDHVCSPQLQYQLRVLIKAYKGNS